MSWFVITETRDLKRKYFRLGFSETANRQSTPRHHVLLTPHTHRPRIMTSILACVTAATVRHTAAPRRTTARTCPVVLHPSWKQRPSLLCRAGTNPFVEGWLDLSNTVTGGGGDLGITELAENLGSDVYMDINGWHLFLKDAKYATPLARIVSNRIAADGNRFDETAVLQILKDCPVKIGAGKATVKLFDLMPSMCVSDFVKIVEDYVDDL